MIKRVWPLVLIDVTFQLLLAAIVLRAATDRPKHLRVILPETAASDGRLVQQSRPFQVEVTRDAFWVGQRMVADAEFETLAGAAHDQGADQAILSLAGEDVPAARFVQAMALLRWAGFQSVATPCNEVPSRKTSGKRK